MTIKASRRFFLSGAGALAAAAFSGAASAQDVIGEILKSDRRGNWDDQFDARASQGDKVASNLPIFSPQTVIYVEQAIGQYSRHRRAGRLADGAGDQEAASSAWSIPTSWRCASA